MKIVECQECKMKVVVGEFHSFDCCNAFKDGLHIGREKGDKMLKRMQHIHGEEKIIIARLNYKSGREAEREEIFGSSKIKPFIKAKGLLNKYVLEQIKEKVRNEERKEFFKEVEKIHIRRCRKCQEAEHDKRLAVCIERKEIQQFKFKGEDEQ